MSVMSILKKICRKNKFGASLHLYLKSYLVDVGWFKSYKQLVPIDSNNEPIPWYSYSSIHFLDSKLQSSFRVFEYGSGFSTKWYSKRVNEVFSVEHNFEWYNSILSSMAPSVHLNFRTLSDGYCDAIKSFGEFEIIVIDGIERLSCLKSCLDNLTPDGVIVWDDSHREDFSEAFDSILEPLGFRFLTFEGLGPINPWTMSTSILYRSNNCLNI